MKERQQHDLPLHSPVADDVTHTSLLRRQVDFLQTLNFLQSSPMTDVRCEGHTKVSSTFPVELTHAFERLGELMAQGDILESRMMREAVLVVVRWRNKFEDEKSLEFIHLAVIACLHRVATEILQTSALNQVSSVHVSMCTVTVH